MELEKIHNCKASEGKIVCISVDYCGVTRCVYCNSVVDYSLYHHNLFKDEILKLIERLKLEKEASKWQNLKNQRKKKRKR
jgi:hypothetical protein